MASRSRSVPSCTAFIDESGDLGFGARASRYLTLAAVVTDDPRPLERIPQKIRKRRLKKSLRRIPELKFHNSSHEIRMAVLRRLVADEDVRVVCLVVDKRNAKDRILERKNEFYLESCGRLAHEVVRLVGQRPTLNLIFDARRGGGVVDSDFDFRIRESVTEACRRMRTVSPAVRVSKLDSVNSGGLQVADYVAGAIHRKYERGDTAYYRVIAPSIAVERGWFTP